MKNLNLLIILLVLSFLGISCSSTTDNESGSQDLSVQAISDAMDNEAAAVEEAIIEEEVMQEEEVETSLDDIKSQAAQKKVTEVKKETKPTAPTTKKETTSTANKKVEKLKNRPKPADVSTSTTTTKKSTKPAKKEANRKPLPKSVPKPAKKSGKPSHSSFNALLGKYVTSSGTVNYAGFKSQKIALQKYLDELADNPVQSSWSRNEKMAYWINLYNASTIKLILDNYPTGTIKKINGGKPWDKRWIKSGKKTYSLNEIENSVLRPQFKDARIHFAVNCAAQSCPRLMNKAFTSSNLNSLLEQNAKWFINNSKFNNISSKKVEISKIFEWYSDDFGNIISYLNKYSTTKIKSNAKVTYMNYDWDLNGK